MIYNKIEWVLVITKWIFNHYNTDFSLEITSKVQKDSQTYTFTHKLTTKRNFQMPSLFFRSTVNEWNAQDCGIAKAEKDTSMLPSKIDQMKASHETGSEANFGFGRALMPSYQAAFSVFGCSLGQGFSTHQMHLNYLIKSSGLLENYRQLSLISGSQGEELRNPA